MTVATAVPDIESPMAKVSQYAATHSLAHHEREQLESVLRNFKRHELDAALVQELEWILVARKPQTSGMLSMETILRAKERFESGKTGFVPQS